LEGAEEEAMMTMLHMNRAAWGASAEVREVVQDNIRVLEPGLMEDMEVEDQVGMAQAQVIQEDREEHLEEMAGMVPSMVHSESGLAEGEEALLLEEPSLFKMGARL
jgi:hypothetical protein